MSSGSTFLRESGSYVLASCAFTKLKNHKCPIHITPAARCVQRKMTFSHSFMESPGWCETTRAPYRLRIDPSREGRPGARRLRSPAPAAVTALEHASGRGGANGGCRAWYPVAAMTLRELI